MANNLIVKYDKHPKAADAGQIFFQHYGGSIYNRKAYVTKSGTLKHEAICVKFTGIAKKDRTFIVKAYPNVHECENAAKAFQKQYSDEHNLTHCFTRSNCSSESRQYVAGLIDGDGCINMTKQGCIRVQLNQASNQDVPQLVLLLCELYGGHISKIISKNPLKRNQFSWCVNGLNALPVLEDLVDHSLIKQPQAKACRDYLFKRAHLYRMPLTDKQKLLDFLKRSKGKGYANIQVLQTAAKLTASYVAGFFDSEGCVRIDKNNCCRVLITQKYCTTIISAIRDRFCPKGWVYLYPKDTAEFGCTSLLAVDFLTIIQPYGNLLRRKGKE